MAYETEDTEQRKTDESGAGGDFFAQLLLLHLKRNGIEFTEAEASVLSCVIERVEQAQSEGSLCVPISEEDYFVLQKGRLCVTVDVAETSFEMMPFIVEKLPGTRAQYLLYKQRNYSAEVELCSSIVTIAKTTPEVHSASLETLAGLTESDSGGFRLNEGQAQAVRHVLNSNFSLIYGGPGTGKTTTAAAVLECLLAGKASTRIFLAAPTGKAAKHLFDSIKKTAVHDRRFSRLRGVVGTLQSVTLHRLLNQKLASGEKPGPTNPFPADVILVDECSMMAIDLAMRFFRAVSPQTRVILMGDAYQLQAVGPGSVFEDLTQAAQGRFATELTESHRFSSTSQLGKLACGIKAAAQTHAGNLFFAQELRENLTSDSSCVIENCLSDSATHQAVYLTEEARRWVQVRAQRLAEAVSDYLKSGDSPEAREVLWKAAMSAVALCAFREGPMSLSVINREVERELRQLLAHHKGLLPDAGRILICRKNSSELDVYNGDVGIVLPARDVSEARQKVFFGDLGEAGREISLGLLPVCEKAFAITIHQSQGSEYRDVAIFLPQDPEHRLAVNELLYTAVTRVKASEQAPGRLTFFGRSAAFDHCVLTRSVRVGGFRSKVEKLLAM